MVALNVFVRERAELARRIIELENIEYDNATDNNLADDERWTLIEVHTYFDTRIKEIQGLLGGE